VAQIATGEVEEEFVERPEKNEARNQASDRGVDCGLNLAGVTTKRPRQLSALAGLSFVLRWRKLNPVPVGSVLLRCPAA
jgi:hypothetical protein